MTDQLSILHRCPEGNNREYYPENTHPIQRTWWSSKQSLLWLIINSQRFVIGQERESILGWRILQIHPFAKLCTSYETMLASSHKDERQDCSICTHRVATHEENKYFLTTISLSQALGGGNDAKQRAGDRKKSGLWGRKREGPPQTPLFFLLPKRQFVNCFLLASKIHTLFPHFKTKTAQIIPFGVTNTYISYTTGVGEPRSNDSTNWTTWRTPYHNS